LSPSLTDTHAHLADPQLNCEVDEIIRRASDAGVERILSVGTNVATSQACVSLADRFDRVYAAVGIHPQDALTFEAADLDRLRTLAAHPKVVAIGETGLDYYRETTPPGAQRSAFEAQAALAAELGLPVIVHNRNADEDVLSILGGVCRPTWLDGRAGVLHCFTGTADVASRGRGLGFYLSFAGNVTYRRSTDLRGVAAALPLEWLLTETDSPYLSPEPLRGKTNSPANVEYVVKTLADIRGSTVDDIAVAVRDNARQLFGWPSS
jgi:TatD DNase family protein